MGERYKKRFFLTRRLYVSGAPVIIESGALLYDVRSNAALCQLVVRNIQSKPIKALRTVIQCLDEQGESLERTVDHRYQDLDLKREEEVGRDSAIVLPSPEARSFSARVSQVSFADGEVWTDEGAEWEALPEPPELEVFCGSEAMAAKFRRHFGTDTREAPMTAGELWFCACGAVNHAEENRCHRCRRRRSTLMSWSAEAPEQSVRETAASEEDDGKDPPPVSFPPRMKRILAVAAGVILAVGLGAVLLMPRASAPAPAPAAEPVDERIAAYAAAELLLDAGDLEQAESAFLRLGDYEDSAERAQACRDALEQLRAVQVREEYDAATALLESGSYSQARAAFLALGDYEDSADMAREAVYRKAQALTRFAEEHDVRELRAALTPDAEQEDLFSMPRERALALGSQGISDLQAACGKDPFHFVTRDGADVELLLLEDAVAELYRSLGDYKDSAELAERLPQLADRSAEFFALCQDGDLPAAQEWLDSHPLEFEGRQLWAERVALYLPFCGDWALADGDPTLLPLIYGTEGSCKTIRCSVHLTEDEAVLRILLNEDDKEGPELTAEPGKDRFYLQKGDLRYMALITEVGNLSVAKYTDTIVVSGVNYRAA